MYSHVLFDFDGVLCDNATSAIAAYHALREREFGQLPVLSGTTDLGDVCSGPSSRWLHDRLTPDEAARFWTAHEAMLGEFSPNMRLFDGVVDLLHTLPADRAAVVTGGQAKRVRGILEREAGGIPDCLVTVVGAETPGTKTEKIRSLCADWGDTTAVFVGDTESDVLAARAASVDAVAVGYGYQLHAQVMRSEPTAYVPTPAALVQFIHERLHTDCWSASRCK